METTNYTFIAYTDDEARAIIAKRTALYARQGFALIEQTDERVPLTTTGRLYTMTFRQGPSLRRAETNWEEGLC